ncbi:hypothetical protein [Mesorhizobium sp. INR15]|uniref:hypothetical protein n=1 Tax=Mesorhizobium sp. INR15 TaxID=2654248 RepID=UPI00189675A3|nr:hypothetical protein [Mesorhizobium sp. INR15]QPC90302.1 hypothetical protein GA829_06695 [Mesorhizobium sp. INR15]
MTIFAKTKPAVPTFRVRSPEEVSSDCVTLAARDVEFENRQHELERDRNALMFANMQNFESDARRSRMEAVADGTMSLADAPEAPSIAMRAKFEAIDRELADIKMARDILRERRVVARRAASAIIVKEVAPEYKRRVVALSEALVAAHQASRALEDIKDQLNVHNVAWTALGPISATSIDGKLAHFIGDAVRGGFVASTDVPEALRP